MNTRALLALLSLTTPLIACERPNTRPTPPRITAEATPPAEADVSKENEGGEARADAPAVEAAPLPEARPWRREGAARVVAMGDVHGDISAMHRALRAADLIDGAGAWSGGEAVLVQTGDLLDRGDDEQEIIDSLARLTIQARAAGGDIVQVVGNHESMNVAGDLRYVTPKGFSDFEDAPGVDMKDPRLEKAKPEMRARISAFLPGGAYAMRLARYHVIAVVGDTAFAHGGVLPRHARAAGAINDAMAKWMRAEATAPAYMNEPDSPMWNRLYSQGEPKAEACATLDEALAALSVKRLVVGHTPQLERGANAACDGKVWRIDTGMAAHYGGDAQVIEITAEGVKMLTSK